MNQPRSISDSSPPLAEPSTPALPQTFPLRAWVALALMVMLVGGAVYALSSRLRGGSGDSRDLVEIISPRGGLGGAFAPPRVQADGVRETGRNSYVVTAGEARLNIRQARDGAWNFNFSYQKRDLLTADQEAALTARWRLPRDSAYAKSLNVTPEQVKQLEQLPGREGMIVSDVDQQRLRQLFEAYVQAAPPRAKETSALVAALREVGTRSLEPTRAALGERAARVRAILSNEQIAPFRRNN